MIMTSGKLIIPAMYDDLSPTHYFFYSKREGKFGLIDSAGVALLPCEFDRIEFLSDKIISATSNGMLQYVMFKPKNNLETMTPHSILVIVAKRKRYSSGEENKKTCFVMEQVFLK